MTSTKSLCVVQHFNCRMLRTLCQCVQQRKIPGGECSLLSHEMPLPRSAIRATQFCRGCPLRSGVRWINHKLQFMIGYSFWRQALFTYSRQFSPSRQVMAGLSYERGICTSVTELAPLLSRCARGDSVSVDSVTAKGYALLPINLEHLCNDSGKRRPKCSQRNPPQWHFALRKSHKDTAGIKPRPLQWQADD